MQKFETLLSEAMKVTIMQIFGKAAFDTIYRSAESHISLKREDIGEKFEAFCLHLEKLLGPEKSMIIHTASLKRLCLTLKQEYEKVDSYFSLLDKLYEVKFKLVDSSLVEERSSCNW